MFDLLKRAFNFQGDSGGALLNSNKEQIGISSFITNICGIANKDTPNVYGRVDYFYEWIKLNTQI